MFRVLSPSDKRSLGHKISQSSANALSASMDVTLKMIK